MLVKKHKKHNTIHIGRTKIKFNNEDFASLAKTKVSMEPKGETGQPSANKSRRFMEQKLVLQNQFWRGGEGCCRQVFEPVSQKTGCRGPNIVIKEVGMNLVLLKMQLLAPLTHEKM